MGLFLFFFFFFQAEEGIRDRTVTGVQTVLFRSQIDVAVTPHAESAYLVARIAYQRRVPDRIEHSLYAPILAPARRAGTAGRALADGSVHRYLAYGFAGVT